jgi:hypothetical protein
MLQPFEPFNSSILIRLIKLERPWLVTQTYHRSSPSPDEKIPLLITDYNELGGARLHLNAVKKDRYAAIIDLQNDKHRKKLEDMLLPDSKYQLFFAVVHSVKGLENKINSLYRENVKRYIDRQTNWRLRGGDEVRVSVQLTFGELFLVLKHGSQTIRVRLEEIEAILI